MRPSSRQWYRFGPFRLCDSEGVLEKDGQAVSMSPRTFDILSLLVKNSPNLVTIEQLIEGVWNDVTVEPSNLTQHVFSARKALGDNSQSPVYIQNVPKRGYRFIAPVERYEEEPVEPEQAPVAPPAIEQPPQHAVTPKARRLTWLAWAAIPAAILVAAPLIAFLPVTPPELHITGYQQLTHDGGQKEGPLLIEGKQVIYRSTEGTTRMWAIPIAGGEAIPVGGPGEIESDVSADGRSLLFSSVDPNGGAFCFKRSIGGEQQPLTEADSGSWSPDGKRLAAAYAGTLTILEGKKQIAKILVTGQAANPRWSPDGQRIRFSVVRTYESAIWEVNADGSAPHQIDESSVASVVGNGSWNPEGDLFWFTAHTGGADNIWVSRVRKLGMLRQDSKPVALTNGPGDWRWPVGLRDSREILAIHSVSAPQLTSLDDTNKEWKPYWHGSPAYEMDFSRDGKWATFVQFPDHTLWRAKADGSERVQLTSADLEAHEPHWSPDGKRIAFMSRGADHEWRVRIISASGGPAEEAAPDKKGQGVPTWSPDGKSIIFGDRTAEAKPGPRMNIHYVDLATRKESDLPNSYGLWSPRWSPDGKYIAAPSYDGTNLAILKWPGNEWKNILRLRRIENVMWSADSRYIYFKGQKTVECWGLYRLRLADNALEMVADLKDFRWPAETWFGLTPQGTPLALYESSPQEVFAINYEMK